MIGEGFHFSKYAVGAALGKGGFGVVHVARDHERGHDVAIKLLRVEHVHREGVLQRFFQEARAAARIQHAGVVRVFECGVVANTGTPLDGTAFIAMEKLEGKSLAQHVRDHGRLELVAVIALARQLAAALQASHAAGIVHRDLKPDNVHVAIAADGALHAKVLDFGVAKLADPEPGVHTETKVMLGTPRYMSPEQTRSAARVDHRSDIYALGCMLYELVCGRTPFTGGIVELVLSHQSRAPVPPRELDPGVPAELDALIVRMLAKSPADRPATMADVERALAAIVLVAPDAVAPHAASASSSLVACNAAASLAEPASASNPLVTRHALASVAEPAPAPRRWHVLAGAGVLAVAAAVAFVIAAGRGSSVPELAEPVAAREPAAPEPIASEPASAIARHTPPADAIRQLEIDCLGAVNARRWADVERCGQQLAALDPAPGQVFVKRGVAEREAASALRSLTAAVGKRDRKAANAALGKIGSESVYRSEAVTKAATLAHCQLH